jgi:hypothetical protein
MSDLTKKQMVAVMMDFMDDFVETHFVFNEPLIKKQDNLNEGKGYGTDKRKLINFMFQVDKPSRKDIKSYVEGWCVGNLTRLDD